MSKWTNVKEAMRLRSVIESDERALARAKADLLQLLDAYVHDKEIVRGCTQDPDR